MNPLLKYRQFFLGVASSIAIAVTYSYWPGSEQASKDLVALVSGESITVEQFQAAWRKQQLANTPENREFVLQRVIERSALAQEATQNGLAQSPAAISDWQGILIARLKEEKTQP